MTDFGRRAGDMKKSVYDTNGDGVVDNSELLEGSSKAAVQTHTPASHGHGVADISGIVHDASKIAGVVINDAAKADQKVLAYDSGTDRIVYITPAASGAALQSIQSGTILLEGTDLSVTAAISSVDVAKSFIIHLGQTQETGANGPVVAKVLCYLEIVNATTIRAVRKLATADVTSLVSFIVVEFATGINSIQRGINEPTGVGDTLITVTAVDVAKSFLTASQNSGSGHSKHFMSIKITNSTTLALRMMAGGALNPKLSWELVEFE
ncbi:hypothetical protein LCGC14_1989160 [marine sediment metagenome]|uniref:EF-hand domain-containing protein n=1 Tax=marine sediment metagenome TaxID=412755 RepID=A0A0F9F6D8_9ZZZZ|nr:hypothetical protein [Desulfobacterales bacterium]